MVDEVVVEEVTFEGVAAESKLVLDEEFSTCSAKVWMLETMKQHCLQVRRLTSLTESVGGW